MDGNIREATGGAPGAGWVGSSDHDRRRFAARAAFPIECAYGLVAVGGKRVTRTPTHPAPDAPWSNTPGCVHERDE
jgi:hypothetical protein